MIPLRKKIAQMLIMGFNGCEIDEYSPVSRWLAHDGLGGVLLFDQDWNTREYGKNLKDPEQIKELIKKLHVYSARSSSDGEVLPLFIAIDYEGGAVDRLSKINAYKPTLKAKQLASLPEMDLKKELNQMASTLKSLGFNLNFAPVVDLALNNERGIIGKLGRSFSNDPELVASIARQFVDVFAHHGIVCAYKHFPGHGSAVADTHEGFVDVTDTFVFDELIPYRRLLQEVDQPSMVMTAHVVNKHLDSKGLPATLSHAMLTGILREQMGYEGVIVSDDLQMQAISSHYSLEESLCLTINAGADIIIFGNQLDSITAPEVIDCIEQLVINEKIDQQHIENAYQRIMGLKQQIYNN